LRFLQKIGAFLQKTIRRVAENLHITVENEKHADFC